MTEYRLIITAVCVFCTLAPVSWIWLVIDLAITSGLIVGVGLVVLVTGAREAAREIRFRREMRALDARDPARAARLEVSV